MRRLADIGTILILLAVCVLYVSKAVALDAANHEIDQLKVQLVEHEAKLDACNRERLKWLEAVGVLGGRAGCGRD